MLNLKGKMTSELKNILPLLTEKENILQKETVLAKK